MRTEGPFPLPCAAGVAPDASSPIPIRDYLYKTVEVTGLTGGTLNLQIKVANVFFSVLQVAANGAYHLEEAGFFLQADATLALGASLQVNLVAINARAD